MGFRYYQYTFGVDATVRPTFLGEPGIKLQEAGQNPVGVSLWQSQSCQWRSTVAELKRQDFAI